ncbi:MAG: FAD-dependent oxidoreductase, partial [Gemmatimonadota bacterium]
ARRAIETVAGIFRSEGGRIRVAEARLGGHARRRLWDLELDDGEQQRAGTFVFALGPWFPKVFPDLLGRKIRIPMGHVFYYGTPSGDHRFAWPNLPSYNVPGCTGWPALPPDHRGFRVRTGGAQHDDPDRSPRWVGTDKFERPRQILRDYFPLMQTGPLVETRTCHYELSVTRNFIIDRHPDFDNVWLAGGGSAEAFKFGPVTGEYVAMRTMGVGTDPELDKQFRIPDEEFEEAAPS